MSEQEVISGIAPALLEDQAATTVGGALYLGISTTAAEHRKIDSFRIPQEQWWITEMLRFKVSRRLSISVGASVSKTKLLDTGTILESSGADVGVGWNTRAGGRLSARAFYRSSTSRQYDLQDQGIEATYEWRFGEWYPRLRYRFDSRDNETVDTSYEGHQIYFDVRRQFR